MIYFLALTWSKNLHALCCYLTICAAPNEVLAPSCMHAARCDDRAGICKTTIMLVLETTKQLSSSACSLSGSRDGSESEEQRFPYSQPASLTFDSSLALPPSSANSSRCACAAPPSSYLSSFPRHLRLRSPVLHPLTLPINKQTSDLSTVRGS
jgi:hypothetical protein